MSWAIRQYKVVSERDLRAIDGNLDLWVERLPVRGWLRKTKEANRAALKAFLIERTSLLEAFDEWIEKVSNLPSRIVSEQYEDRDVCALYYDSHKDKMEGSGAYSFTDYSKYSEEVKNTLMVAVTGGWIPQNYMKERVGGWNRFQWAVDIDRWVYLRAIYNYKIEDLETEDV
jgi:hypothetical protein